MVCVTETVVFGNEKMLLAGKTIFRVTKKMVSGFLTVVFVSHTVVPVVPTTVFVFLPTISLMVTV